MDVFVLGGLGRMGVRCCGHEEGIKGVDLGRGRGRNEVLNSTCYIVAHGEFFEPSRDF